MNINIRISESQLAAFCRRHSIRRLALFGSVLRSDFRDDSDVDVLVEFDSNAVITYLDMADIQDELAAILGREVDLLTPNALSKYFRQKVLDTAQTLYERG